MNKKILHIILGFFAVCTVSLLIRKNISEANKLEKEGVYVIAKMVKIEGAKGGQITTEVYSFNGKKYTSRGRSYEVNRENIGRSYLLKILPSDPDGHCNLYLDKEIMDTTIQAPFGGWKTFPDSLFQ